MARTGPDNWKLLRDDLCPPKSYTWVLTLRPQKWFSYNQVIQVGLDPAGSLFLKGRLIQENGVKAAMRSRQRLECWNKNCEPLSKAGRSQKDPSLQPSRLRARPYLISHVSHRIVRINGWCLSCQVIMLWCGNTSRVAKEISFRDDIQNFSTQYCED